MKRALLIVCAVVLFSGVALTSALADTPYNDPVGDATGNAPDLTQVVVSNDTGGNLLFHVAVTNGTPESMVRLWLDTDKNYSTGDSGFDYELGLQTSADANSDGWWLGQWSTDHWADAPQHSTVQVYDDASTYIDFRINKSELGNTAGFSFSVESVRFTADAITGFDASPDGFANRWTYDLTTPPPPTPTPTPAPAPAVVKPVFGVATIVPARPVAGKKAVFTLTVKRSDTGAPLTTGTMICDPSVAGKVVKHGESFKAGKAKLTFVVPKTAKGKLLKVKVKIVNGTQSSTKVVTYRVK